MEFLDAVSLRERHTFGMDVRARRFAVLSTLDDLPAIRSEAEHSGRVLWLGGGSNLLFTRDFDGLVVQIALKGIRTLADDGKDVIVEAAAGENWHDFVRHTLARGWHGLENLSLIPGTVGASPVQNIGAYGVEVKDCISEVVCADLDDNGRLLVLGNADCRFGYRDSIFKRQAAGRLLVVAVRFKLSRQAAALTGYGDIRAELARMGRAGTPSALDISDAVMHIRAAKLPDPAHLGNAGSFFKNPVLPAADARALIAHNPELPHYAAGTGKTKLAAGWLIEQAGFKGLREGDAGVHARQALVLVNYGHASGKEIQALAQRIQEAVHTRYGVALEAEPVIL
ncbi:UDP-N-acetylmuramate dehydrogenase [Paludibacterium yongneupense]|uniref:UDP-N-acetylmuramate dehydrogenase n=2 Tax=Paludibacterium yongneupense TaxID=400061 RepID=UPI003D154C28